MAAHLENFVLDNGLGSAGLGTANKITLCGTEPTTYTEGNSTYALASATNGAGFTAPLIGSPANRAPNGRKVATAVVSGAAVSSTGTGLWAAILDTGNSRLLAVLAMTSQALTSGNTWGAASVDIGIPAQ
jgi:hypothetical protein